MPLPKLITSKWLLKKGACPEQVTQFEEQWPDGAEITPKNVRKAQRMELDLCWFVNTCLPKRIVEAFYEQSGRLIDRRETGTLSQRGYERLDRALDRDTILRAAGKAEP